MRIRSLDSLRGVAALLVVIHHVYKSLPSSGKTHLPLYAGGLSDPWSWYNGTPLCLLSNGPGAVLIFFVLSGVVLSISLERKQRYRTFIVRRFARIWIPFAVAIFLSAALAYIFHSVVRPGVGQWFNDIWPVGPTAGMVLAHLALLGTDMQLDGVMWSLVHEARISVVFPLIMIIALRWPVRSVLIATSLLIPLRIVGLFYRDGVIAQMSQTLSYAFLFLAGAAIGTRIQLVQRFVGALTPRQRRCAWVIALVLLTLAPANNWAPIWTIGAIYLVLSGAGAIVVIMLCTREGVVTRYLESPAPTWLGKVSYSLYLIHYPIYVSVLRALPNVPMPQASMLAVGVTLMASELFYRAVERPSIELGRAVSARSVRKAITAE